MLKSFRVIGAILGALYFGSGICNGAELKIDNGSMSTFVYYSPS